MKDLIIKLFNDKFDKLDQALLTKYVDFCLTHTVNKHCYEKYACECHHILPKNKECFPELKQNKNFQVYLLCKDHFIAHSILAKLLPLQSITFAWKAMLDRTSKLRKINLKDTITPELYQELKEIAKLNSKEISKGKVSVFKDGKFQFVSKEEFDKFKYPTWNSMYLNAFEKGTNKRVIIRKEDYTPNKYYIHTNGHACYYNIQTETREWVKKENVNNNHIFLNNRIFSKNCCGIITYTFVRKLGKNNTIFGIPIKDLKCRIMKS